MDKKLSKTYSLTPEAVEILEALAIGEQRKPSPMLDILIKFAVPLWIAEKGGNEPKDTN